MVTEAGGVLDMTVRNEGKRESERRSGIFGNHATQKNNENYISVQPHFGPCNLFCYNDVRYKIFKGGQII